MAPLYPQDDEDTMSLVRGLTLYEDTEKEIPQPTLEKQLRLAKMDLATVTGSQQFYAENGLGQALVYATAIKAKVALENYSVSSWDMGVGEIDVSGTSDDEAVQFSQWAKQVANGLSSEGYSTNTSTNINSANYIG